MTDSVIVQLTGEKMVETSKGDCMVMRLVISWVTSCKTWLTLLLFFVILFALPACSPLPVGTQPASTGTPVEVIPEGLSPAAATALQSLRKVDDYPLFTMQYEGDYRLEQSSSLLSPAGDLPRSAWGCSLFAALADSTNLLYGRNFDWEFSPALLLFTYPPDGYASVSMVDLAYLGFYDENLKGLENSPLENRIQLLNAPFIPFDGMNEKGLAIGMAAVPPGSPTPDPNKPTIGSTTLIREILDRAKTVDEAVEIIESYNVSMKSGPHIHYLIADANGKAVLVEYSQGKMVVMPNQQPWHLATNFLCSEAGDDIQGHCSRYDRILARLTEKSGMLSVQQAMLLLDQVSQELTQWSVVYQLSKLKVSVKMGRDEQRVYEFELEPAP